jgi:pimeloyl-ACP methyl ester carboxylesterase
MSEPALHYETIAANGLHFNVATAGDGDRLALLLHGFPETSFSWRHQIPYLANLGYRVWAPDLRGYGRTSRPIGVKEYAIEKLCDDVAGLIDASGAKHVSIVAHDWGGGIAWTFATRRIRPIERLAVLNCPHPACMQQGMRSPAQLRKSWYMFFFQIPWVPEALFGARHAKGVGDAILNMAVDKSRFPEEVLAVYRDNAAEPGALTAMMNYYRAMFRGMRELMSTPMPRIEVPTLLIWGEEDLALGKELTFGTDRYVDDLTVRYLPRVSHFTQQEAPDTVNVLLEAFLAGRPIPKVLDAA